MAFHDLSMRSIGGEVVDFGTYKGKFCLAVNVASECGLTPQYRGLQELQNNFREKGFTVLGFPCNQFGEQEPGSDDEICEFATSRYDVDFPLFAKVEVNGSGACELYQLLKAIKPRRDGNPDIAWNFTKFLVDGGGNVIERFEPRVTAEMIAARLDALL